MNHKINNYKKNKRSKSNFKRIWSNEQTISTLTDEIKELVNGIDYKKQIIQE